MFNTESGVFKTSYQADMAVTRAPLSRWAIYVFLLLFLIALPLLGTQTWFPGGREYVLSVVNLILVSVVGAVGLNILVGYTGQISVGHGAFIALGAYATAILADKFQSGGSPLIPFWLMIPISGIVAMVAGLIFGIPSLRVKGLYLAMATLAAQFIIEWLLLHSSWLTGKGAQGALLVPRATIADFQFRQEWQKFYLLAVVAILAVIFAENLFRSRVGRAFIAIRDREIAAEIMGVNVFGYKLLAFAITAFYAGITGSIWAYYVNVVSYEHFTIVLSISYLAMIIIGGLGSIPGAIFGAVFITLLPVILREVIDALKNFVPWLEAIYSFVQQIMFGAVIILFLIFEPEGLYKIWKSIKNYFRLWPFSY